MLCYVCQVHNVPTVLPVVHAVLGDELHSSRRSSDLGRSLCLILLDLRQVAQPAGVPGINVSLEGSQVGTILRIR